jgi:hypothetical protein
MTGPLYLPGRLLRRPLCLLVLLLLSPLAHAADPPWWAERGVTTAAPPSNLSPATIGQAKWMVKQALAELEGKLDAAPFLALKSEVEAVIDLAAPESPAEVENQRKVLVIGQLKSLSKPFYDHLRTIDPTWLDAQMTLAGTRLPIPGTDPVEHSPYPWPVPEDLTRATNFAPAALGQLKSNFALNFEDWRTPVDLDADDDGMPDAWEIANGLNPQLNDATADPDNDGVSNLQEYQNGTNPDMASSPTDLDGDGVPNGEDTDPNDASVFTPWFSIATVSVSGMGTQYYEDEEETNLIYDNLIGTIDWNGELGEEEFGESELTVQDLIDRMEDLYQDVPGENPFPGYVNHQSLSRIVEAPVFASFGKNTENMSSAGAISRHKMWVHAPPKQVEQKFLFLKRSRTVVNGVLQSEIIDMISVKIPAYGRKSAPIDLEASLAPAAGTQSYWTGVNLEYLPVEVTVVFGIGPSAPAMPGSFTSRELLESYLDAIKVSRTGDVWVVNGKNNAGADRLYSIEIADTEEILLSALRTPGMTVVFDGHANFGLGPNFSIASFKNITDFTNFGVDETDIPQSFRGDGSEPDPMPYYGPNGQPLPNDPLFAAPLVKGVSHLNEEGWAYLTLQPNEVMGTVINNNVPHVGGLRYKNDQGVNDNQLFTKQGQGFNNEWHYTYGGIGEKRLIVKSPGNQVPELRYETFFYNACDTGVHFIENFQHGNFVYTKNTCVVRKATSLFIRFLVEGKNAENATLLLDGPIDADENPNLKTYDIKSF